MFLRGFYSSNSPILPTSVNFIWKEKQEKDKQNFQLMQFYQTVSSLNIKEWIAILLLSK